MSMYTFTQIAHACKLAGDNESQEQSISLHIICLSQEIQILYHNDPIHSHLTDFSIIKTITVHGIFSEDKN